MCNVTSLVLVLCVTFVVLHEVNGYNFIRLNNTRIRRQAQGPGQGNSKCPNSSDFRCKSGECIAEDKDAECNGLYDCVDGSDEDPLKCEGKITPKPTDPVPVTTPPGPDPELPKASCRLPHHPQFGKWMVIGRNPNFSPGTPVGEGTLIKVSCQSGYKLDGTELIFCNNGQWSTPIGNCLKTCPPLYSTTSTMVSCIHRNQSTDANCTEAVDGSLAKFKCAFFYENLALNDKPFHTICRNGSWIQPIPECLPVCGRKSVTATELILNGTTVTKGDYPWQVAIYTAKKKVLICGGSLISESVIVTAAHCVCNNKGEMHPKENYIVAVGKYYRPYDDPRDATEAQFSPLHAMYVPEQYKGSTLNYLGDIAVLITVKSFTLSPRVQPVCVDWGLNFAKEVSNPPPNTFGYVTGWGYTAEDANPSEELRELKVPAVTNEQCRQELPQDYEVYLTYDKFCAGYLDQGTSVCKGDTGGLVFKHQKRYYLTGVVSLSPQAPTGGCDSQQYGLYTSVYKYIEPFISSKVSKFKPGHICRDGSWNQQKPECPLDCGRKSVTATELIVNGTTVTRGDYPWQVAIYTAKDRVLRCGGSLINQRLIVTAAHCICDPKGAMQPKENYIVAVGKYYRPYDDPRDVNETQFSPLHAMYVPEQYKGSTQNYFGDIAVLITVKTFTLSSRVQPVCVDWGLNFANELSNPSANTFGYVTGWGTTSENANPSEELKELKVPAVTSEQCYQGLPEDYDIYLTYDKICAGFLDRGTSVCRGDSGGGLVFKHQKRYYLIGIVSLAPRPPTGGCNSHQYGLYTSVYKYIEPFISLKASEFNLEL